MPNVIITALINSVLFFASTPPDHKIFTVPGQHRSSQEITERLTPTIHAWYDDKGARNMVLNGLVDAFITHLGRREAQHYLSQCKKPPLAVFDIDETVLSAYQSLKKNTAETTSYARASAIDAMEPLQPLQRLYTFLLASGVQVVFVSARSNSTSLRTKIIQKLTSSGYPIFVDVLLYSASGKTTNAQWKESVRNALAGKYTIVATIDDDWRNLQGNNVGRWALWVPGCILTIPREQQFYAQLVTASTNKTFAVAARDYNTAHA
ncbi:MAG: HAD family acid phosphatase [Candidatus Babeliales bacterium]|jgi:hypothetical protein